MEIFKTIMTFIFYVGIGVLILKYRKNVKSWTGNFVWAEKYLGRGGTYLILILSGAGFILYGTLVLLGVY